MNRPRIQISATLAALALLTPNCLAGGRPEACDSGSLKGAYAMTITGTRPAPRVLPDFPGVAPGTIEQVIGVFIQVFDGAGLISHAENVTVKGSLSGLFPDQPGTGTYTINPDCTGSFTVNLPQVPAPLVNRMVVLRRGKEFRSVVISPQTLMINVTAARVN